MSNYYAIATNAEGFRRIYDMTDGDPRNFPIATCKLEGEDPHRRFGIYSAECLLTDIEVCKVLHVSMVPAEVERYIEATRKEVVA